jgi:pyruvate oxidase
MTLADYLLARLADAGVRRIYGVPGLALLPLLDALARQDRIEWILMAHENAAAHAAAGESKISGRLGVVATTSGPGALQPLCGVVDANLDRTPLLLITGLVARANLGHWGFQDVDQTSLYRSILPASTTCITAAQTAAVLRSKISLARNQGIAAHLAMPVDLLAEPVPENDPVFTARLPDPMPIQAPAAELIGQAAKAIDRARRPVIVVGRRAHGAGAAILQLAERLDAPVLAAFDGKGAVDESHPNFLGVYGIWGFPGISSTIRAMRESDQVITFGLDYVKPFISDGRDLQGRSLIQVQPSPAFLEAEYESLASLAGPVEAIATALAASVTQRPRSGAVEALGDDRVAAMEDLLERIASAERRQHDLANPLDLLFVLDTRLGPRHVISADSGSHALWAAMFVRLKAGQRMLVSGRLGTMGFSLPALIGARLADPDCLPVGIIGDGCFAMTATELATAARLRLPIVLVVVNNGVLQNVSAQQSQPFGTTLSPIDHVAFARACGADGAVADGSTDLEALIDRAFACEDKPFVIDLRCDPDLIAPLVKWEAATTSAARA